MPFQPTPRSLRDEAMFDLDEMLAELAGAAEAIKHAQAHAMRRLANANRLRHQATEAIRQAQALEDQGAAAWDGIERRRDHRVAEMEAAATIAGHLRGVEVAA